ncbi:MAG: insulinase family protein [Planctomycetota bacterium]
MRALLLTLALLAPAAEAQQAFPFDYTADELPNGLRIVTVPTPHPRVVSLRILVAVGVRDEVERGDAGVARVLGRVLSRGSGGTDGEGPAARSRRIGATRSVLTGDDVTSLAVTCARADLEDVLQFEAARLRQLPADEPGFRAAALAILAEYRARAADPRFRLREELRRKVFRVHSYGHTPAGRLADLETMPDRFEHGATFFARHYRPDRTTVLLVGDVDRRHARELVERFFGDWTAPPMAIVPVSEPEPSQSTPRLEHVEWPSPTQPWLAVGFRGPPFSLVDRDQAVLRVIAELAFGRSSDLYRRLCVRDRTVDLLEVRCEHRIDPYLIWVAARVVDLDQLRTVRRQILATCAELVTEPPPVEDLERVVDHLRFAFLQQLDNPHAIAAAIAGSVARTGTPEAINTVHEWYHKITPEDVRDVASRYLVDERRTAVTLAHEALPNETMRALTAKSGEEFPGVLQPSASPLVSLRLVFAAGAVDDPVGKEGLAHLTAQAVVHGATARRSERDLAAALYPMAASLDVQVDKEMTVLRGSVHRTNLQRFYRLLRECVLHPALVERDVDRLKADAIRALEVDLRGDPVTLGAEVLWTKLFSGHPYEHHCIGRIEAIRTLAAADVRAFWERHYTLDRLSLGVAGGFPDLFPNRLLADLRAGLPDTGAAPRGRLPRLPDVPRTRLTIVEMPTRATTIHVGVPIAVSRGHREWPALWLVRAWLAEHRWVDARLFERLRAEAVGAPGAARVAIETTGHGPNRAPWASGLVRSSQVFHVEVPAAEPANGPFALKAVVHELRALVADGLDEERFDRTRRSLRKSSRILGGSLDRRLGAALGQRWFGLEEGFAGFLQERLGWLTHRDVNRAIRAHLRGDRLQIVVVTADAAAFRDALLGAAPTPPDYGALEVSDERRAEDTVIAGLRLEIEADDIEVVAVDELFR